MGWAWYGVKTVYRVSAKGPPRRPDAHYDATATLIEERVILVRARSHDEAQGKAEAEAKLYTARFHVNPYGQTVTMKRLGTIESFELFDPPRNGGEVWSTTYMLSRTVRGKDVVDRTFGPEESLAQKERRRKFLNREFSGTSDDE